MPTPEEYFLAALREGQRRQQVAAGLPTREDLMAFIFLSDAEKDALARPVLDELHAHAVANATDEALAAAATKHKQERTEQVQVLAALRQRGRGRPA